MNTMVKYFASTQLFLRLWLILLLIFACSASTLKQNNSPLIGKQGPTLDRGGKSSLEVITPTRVNANGNFLSHDLSHRHVYNKDDLLLHRRRRRRNAQEKGVGNSVSEDAHAVLHYTLNIQGEKHMIRVEPNHVFLAPHAVVEKRTKTNSSGNSGRVGSVTSQVSVIGSLPRCHYVGHLVNQTTSKVALSTCDGLKGFLKTEKGEFLIEPIKGLNRKENEPHPHAIYRKDEEHDSSDSNCGSDEYEEALRKREIWERDKEKEKEERENKSDNKIRRKRSVSVERNVEVLVVADKQMIDYYSNEDLNTYILTIMNMVSTIYHDASIGNAVNIIIVRIMLLETPQYEEELEISHNADNTLMSFCQWQHMVNPSSEDHPHHHDVAVLLTRYNICSRSNAHCSTLGLAEIAGMCQPYRSCNVNEDTGLQIAYTIAHEIGHNFGMNHDSPINGCGSTYGVGQHVMSPHLATDNIPITWSNCSRNEITKFLDRNWGTCLLDEPHDVQYTFPELPPGAMYDANHQCRLAFGAKARHCDGIELECQTLWCRVDNRCVTRLEAAAEGTQCGKHKWCYHGECVTMGERPAAIHGNWGEWSAWSRCSRSCGAGVETATRHCDNPPPSNGGKYCTGDRRRYRICNTQDCPNNTISFRAIQCSNFDDEPYKGKNYTWRPVTIEEHPCQLHCKPDNEFYSVELKDSVIDGTPCKPGTRDMCIHGVCKRVACDWTIEGSAQEDRCGLCHGDGTQCVTTQGIFNLTYGVSYEQIVTFPVGARNVRVEELGGAANYLAMKDGKSEKFYLNGNWIIQWSGEYNADGVMMYYKRENDTETLFLPGPVVKPLTLLLLFQTKNVGVKWEYTLPHENATYTPEFHWKHSDWSVCTSTCGTGSQLSKAQCMEKESGLVENKYCDKKKKPKTKVRECNTHPCPAWWWSGPWQPCSVTCGEKGKRRRTVICVRSYGPTEQMALMDSDCNLSLKPHEEESCPNLHPCISDRSWLASQWLNPCKGDPCEYQKRIVTCIAPKGICNPLTKPAERRQCGNITCGRWRVGKWEKCSTTCGDGVQIRNVECFGGPACTQSEEPASVQECKLRNCAFKHEETLIELPSGDLTPPKPDITIKNVTYFVEEDDKKIDFNSTNSTTENKFVISDVNESNITEDYNDVIVNDTPQLVSKDSLGNQTTLNATKTNSKENDNEKEDEEDLMLEREEIPIIENISSPTTYESNKTKISTINENEAEGMINKEPIRSDQYKENATDGEIKNSPNSSSNDSNYESFPDYESAPDDYYEFDPQEGASSRHSEKNKEKTNNNTIEGKIIKIEEETKNEIEAEKKENKIDVLNKENEIDGFEIGNNNKTFIKHSNVERKIKILPEINKTENITHNYNDNYDDNEDYYEDEYYYDDYDHTNNISTNDTIDDRPTGIVEDKIDIEGIQVIEIKLKKNKKNKKGKKGKKESIKKVKVHTGADAIKVLNKFSKKANSKQTSSKMTPKSKTKNQDESVTPIYKWEVGSWSQCSEPCGGGVQHRSVECYSSGALVPPWDCLEFPPPDTQHCNMFQCRNWTVSEFGPCPVTCGKGTRTRNATCIKEGKCHPRDLPNLQEECENAPCVHWVEGPWSMCTKSCGAGYQIRFVKCVDMRSQEASQDCVEERPAHKRGCNNNKCPEKILGQQNHCKDFLDSTLCKRLVHMCSTKYFKVKCCRTCHRLRG